jgi:hypothetical protein
MVFYDSARSEVNILNMNKTQFETHRSMSYAIPFTRPLRLVYQMIKVLSS